MGGICFVIGIFFLTLVVADDTTRYKFYFEGESGKRLQKEVRYIKSHPHLDPLEQYIEELLLGPHSNKLNPLFPRKTRIISCFVREKVLYLDLTPDAFTVKSKNFQKAIEVFQKNIYTNFKNIDSMHVYISGMEVYAKDL